MNIDNEFVALIRPLTGDEGAVRFGLLVAGVPGLILLLHPIYEKEKIKAYMKEAVGWEL